MMLRKLAVPAVLSPALLLWALAGGPGALASPSPEIAQTDKSAFDALGQQLNNQLQSVSGVDPNEELMRLVQYQRSYQMSAQFITTPMILSCPPRPLMTSSPELPLSRFDPLLPTIVSLPVPE